MNEQRIEQQIDWQVFGSILKIEHQVKQFVWWHVRNEVWWQVKCQNWSQLKDDYHE